MPTKYQFRRDSATAWSTANPVLSVGEIGLDLTNSVFKIGDGTNGWNALTAWSDGSISAADDTTFTGKIVYTNTVNYQDSAVYDSDVTYNGANVTYAGGVTYSGAITYSLGATINGDTNFNGPATFNDSAQFNVPSKFNDTLKIHEIIENADIDATAWPTKKNFDLKDFAVFYNTDSADVNITANIRGDSATKLDSAMAIGESMTTAILMTLGDSAVGGRRSITALTVDSNAVTPMWPGGNAPDSGASNALNVYTYTLMKTAAATFTVIGQRTDYS